MQVKEIAFESNFPHCIPLALLYEYGARFLYGLSDDGEGIYNFQLAFVAVVDFFEVVPLGARPERIIESPHALGCLLLTLEACPRIQLVGDRVLGVLLSW